MTRRLSKKNKNAKTKKIFLKKQEKEKKHKINGKFLSKREGWITIEIYGSPFERGFAHGFLLSEEMENNMKSFSYLIKKDFNVSQEKYISICCKKIKPIIQTDFPEFFDELLGITEGFVHKGLKIDIDYLIAWNSFLSMYSYFENKNISRCSAFIACGEATEKGDIVMAHNTFSYLYICQLQNIVIYLKPDKGHPFLMQTVSGYIASGTDWFICSTGIIGCETTISEINYVPEFGSPYFCRIRKAMQYGKTLDDYVEIMMEKNAGDYACSWLFGDINKKEIMLFDLGLKTHSIKRTTNGIFHGMNSVIDNHMRKEETNDKELYNIKNSSGSRNNRLSFLLNDKYYGKINLLNSKKVLSDHYDEYLNKEIMNNRNICNHGEINNKKNVVYGCTDGKVVNSKMAREMSFLGRFGSCCGRKFSVDSFIKKNPKFKKQKDLLQDIPKYDWIKLGIFK